MIGVASKVRIGPGWTSPEFDGSDPNGTLNPNVAEFRL